MAKPRRELTGALEKKSKAMMAHWALVNERLPAGQPLVVLADLTLEAFGQLWEGRKEGAGVLQDRLGDEKLARERLRGRRTELHELLVNLRQRFRADFPGGVPDRAMPNVPKEMAAFEIVRDAARQMGRVWARQVTGEWAAPDGPVVLRGGVAQADFEALVARFEAEEEEVGVAEFEVRFARAELEVRDERIVAALKAYGHAVRGRLPEESGLFALIPRLWPSRADPAEGAPAPE